MAHASKSTRQRRFRSKMSAQQAAREANNRVNNMQYIAVTVAAEAEAAAKAVQLLSAVLAFVSAMNGKEIKVSMEQLRSLPEGAQLGQSYDAATDTYTFSCQVPKTAIVGGRVVEVQQEAAKLEIVR